MGADPKTSALNRYLQSWDVPNLFVMGASAFPQNAGYNPTGTVGALAFWSAAAIRGQYLKNPGPLVACVSGSPSIALGAWRRRSLPAARARRSVVADSPISRNFGQIETRPISRDVGRLRGLSHRTRRRQAVRRRPRRSKRRSAPSSRRTSRRIAKPASAPGPTTQFDDAVRRGIRPDGARLYPAMPYTCLHQDVARRRAGDPRLSRHRRAGAQCGRRQHAAVPVQHPRRDARSGTRSISREGEFKPDPQQVGRMESRRLPGARARRIAAPAIRRRTFLGGDKTSEYLHGANLQGWFAPDITNDPAPGSAAGRADDIVGLSENRP